MSEWRPAADVPGLATSTSAAGTLAQPVLPVGATPVEYSRQDVGQMPARAVASLKGHARPIGEVSDWPLDDGRIGSFQEAIRLRKRISGAAKLYSALLLLTIIGSVIVGVGATFAFGVSGGGGSAASLAIASAFGLMVGMCILYFFAHRATMRSHRWAPLTMFILFLLVTVANGFSMIGLASMRGGMGSGALASPCFTIILCPIFAIVSWRAFVAIPPYRNTPAWCQELIALAKL